MIDEVLLIDGRNYLYRHCFTRTGLSSKGRPTGGIFGALTGLIRLHKFFPNAAIVFCWDMVSSNSWRHELEPGYKSNRKPKEGAEIPKVVLDIRTQIPIIEKFIRKFGFRQFSVPRLEADDLIGVLATAWKDHFRKIIIYSTDRDYYQLIKDNVVVVRDFDKTLKCKEITAREIRREFGVAPKDWLRYRALVGDSGDKIDKPIKGVGPKKAIAMLKAGVDASDSNPHPDYKEHWRKIRLAYKLSKIVRRYDDSRVSAKTQKRLERIIRAVSDSGYRLSRKNRNQKTYDYMMEFLVDYELVELIQRRELLWVIK
jgi:DNA polymerase-1